VLAALPFFLGSYHNYVYRKLLLWIHARARLQLPVRHLRAGGPSRTSAFYGIGAYSVVILLFQFNLPLPVAIVLGVGHLRGHRARRRHPFDAARGLLSRAGDARARRSFSSWC
jgi:hypothetical protein